jgi:predicted Zn-dependent protease
MIIRGYIRRLILSAAVIVLAALALGCQTMAGATGVLASAAGALGVIDPNTTQAIVGATDAIGRAAEEITPEQEYYIGRAVGANLLTNYTIYTQKPALTAYLNKICGALTVNSPKPELYNGYHVVILNTPEINAFSTSGGHIFVTLGLLDCTNSEDTLAAVIAHEIAHIQLQHSIKSIKTSRFTSAVMETANAAATAATGTNLKELTEVFGQSVDEAVNNMVNNGYSQSQEYDADATALSLLASAGYEPSSLITMLNMLREKQVSQSSGRGFGKTHPDPAKRIDNANTDLPKYRVPDTRSFRTARYRGAL